MKEYFLLKFKMTNRRLMEMGIQPIIGYILGVLGLIIFSEYVFDKIEFGKYIIIVIALKLLVKASEKERTEFLMIVFGNKKYLIIRILENLIISLPILILLICHNAIFEAIVLMIVGSILGCISFKNNFKNTMPTPFYKKPFEFAVGFRNTFLILLLVYFLTFIAVSVENLNVGLFSLVIVFLVCSNYYVKPENEYFVWTHSTSPSKFLFGKLVIATVYSVYLSFPIAIILLIFYTGDFKLILMFLLIGIIFLWTIILAKYSVYKYAMNIPEWILIAICIYFPPFILFLLPYFYFKSVKKLSAILK